MSERKNIKRNQNRPKSSKRAFVASIYGKTMEDRDNAEYKRINDLKAKLESWKSLCK